MTTTPSTLASLARARRVVADGDPSVQLAWRERGRGHATNGYLLISWPWPGARAAVDYDGLRTIAGWSTSARHSAYETETGLATRVGRREVHVAFAPFPQGLADTIALVLREVQEHDRITVRVSEGLGNLQSLMEDLIEVYRDPILLIMAPDAIYLEVPRQDTRWRGSWVSPHYPATYDPPLMQARYLQINPTYLTLCLEHIVPLGSGFSVHADPNRLAALVFTADHPEQAAYQALLMPMAPKLYPQDACTRALLKRESPCASVLSSP